MLIKKTLIILLCLVLFNIVYGQNNVFNQNYNYTGNIFTNPLNGNQYYNNESFRSLFEMNDKVIGLGRSFNNRILFPNLISINEQKLFFIETSDGVNGEIYSYNIYPFESLSEGVKLNQSSYLLFGSASTSENFIYDSFGTIYLVDNNQVSLLDSVNLGFNSVIRGGNYDMQSNTVFSYGFILDSAQTSYETFVQIKNDVSNDIFLFVNDLFNMIPNHMTFSDTGIIISGSSIDQVELHDNAFLTFLNPYTEDYLSKEFSRNTSSIFLSRKSSHVFQLNNFYLVGTTILSGGGPFPAVEGGLLIKTDSVGNELWQKTYNRGDPDYSEFFKGIKAHPDGTLIVAGGTRDYSTNPPSSPRGWLMKLDTAGNKIWERVLSRYHEFDWDDYVNDLILTSDGGIALAGYLIHNFIQDENDIFHRNDAWLVKTDSCGYTVGDIPEPLIYVGQNIDGLSIQLHNLSEKYCSGTITWGDNTEDHVYAYSEPIYGHNSTLLTHTYTQPGTYEICLEALAGQEYRTYCTEVVLEPNSLASASLSQREVKIFPNPTNNYFILELPLTSTPLSQQNGTSLSQQNESLMAERSRSQIQIYNLNGQLVHQFPIKNQPQQKIDIHNLPQGVYIIKIYSSPPSGELVGAQKLVVVR